MENNIKKIHVIFYTCNTCVQNTEFLVVLFCFQMDFVIIWQACNLIWLVSLIAKINESTKLTIAI